MKILLLLSMLLSFLFSLGFNKNNDFLPANKAFGIESRVKDGYIITHIKLAKDIHIYEEELKFTLLSPKKIDLTPYAIKPKAHKDSMNMMVYNHDIDVKIPLDKIDAKKFKLKVELSGCSDKGMCYPPFSKTFDLTGDNTTVATAKKVSTKTMKKDEKQKIQTIQSEEISIVNTLKHGSLLTIITMFFGFGLLLALTPCIFPMIPILSSIIVSASKDKEINALKGLFLSSIYVLSMSIAYTIAGVIAGLFGAKFNIQAAMQNPFVLVIFALIFIALAFSMFGYYNIEMPQSIQNKLSLKSQSAGDRGGVIGVAIMGFLSALIVGPCVAPALAGALVYIGQTGDALLGGTALFVMSLGMGMPLLLVGLGAGKFMPKPGGWMTKVSQFFGVVMLGLAIWMLDRVLPETFTLILWGLLFIGSAIYMDVFGSVKDIKGMKKLFKVLAYALLLIGSVEFIGAISGAKNPLNPLEKFTSSTKITHQLKANFQRVNSIKELEKIIKESKKPVLVDFSAKWCVSCKELEESTFKDTKVLNLFQKFKLIRVDITKNSDEDKRFLEKFSLVGPPAILFFKDGKFLENHKIIGYKPASYLIPILEKILGE